MRYACRWKQNRRSFYRSLTKEQKWINMKPEPENKNTTRKVGEIMDIL
jgi:hypothetical protein